VLAAEFWAYAFRDWLTRRITTGIVWRCRRRHAVPSPNVGLRAAQINR